MHSSAVALLLLQLGVVLGAGRVLARVARLVGQPSVIAEIVAGIVLGPSLLGWLWPEAMATLFPAESLPGLSLLSQLGLVFFMFLVGLEFDPRLLEGRGRQSLAISISSIVVPFVLGLGLAVPLHASDGAGVRFWSFALFVAAALSITAFPVLARILAEKGMIKSGLGAVALAAAAVNDVVAWCILAFVVSIARAEGLGPAAVTSVSALVYVGVMFGFVRPLLARLGPRQGAGISAETVAITLLLLLGSALATELIGIHALFGGFALGAVMPRGAGLSAALVHKLEDFVTIVLLPLFFALSGLRTEIGLVQTTDDWLVCAGVVAVACVGKFGGSAVVARVAGMSWRESSAIGVLMNTRGLMELIVLNVGLDLGVLSPRLFTMLVIMALVTTAMTSPLLEWVAPRRKTAEVAADAARPPLVCVSDPAIVAPLLGLVRRLAPEGVPVPVLHVVRSDRPSAYLGEGPVAEERLPLDVAAEHARALGVEVVPVSVVADDPARDIVRVAAERGAGLVLLGSHRPLLGESQLAGVVGRVLGDAPMDVAVLVDRAAGELVDWVAVGAPDPAIEALTARLTASGLPQGAEPGPRTLVVARIGQAVPVGSALLVRPRRGGG